VPLFCPFTNGEHLRLFTSESNNIPDHVIVAVVDEVSFEKLCWVPCYGGVW